MKRDSLITLIQAMSGPEKRYFKLQGRVHGAKEGAKFVRLFDLLANNGKLDRKVIQKEMAWSRFGPNYTMAKKHLEAKILGSLENYQVCNSETDRIRLQIRQARVLERKKLDGLAYKKIEKALKRCLIVQSPVLALELMQLKSVLLNRNAQQKAGDKEVFRLGEEMREVAEAIFQLQTAYSLHNQLFLDLDDESKHLGEDELLRQLDALTLEGNYSFLPKIYRISARNQIFFMQGEFEASQKILFEGLELFASHPAMTIEYGGKYIGMLHNYLARSIARNDYTHFEEIMERIRNFRPASPALAAKKEETYMGLGLLVMAISGSTDVNAAFWQQILQRKEAMAGYFSQGMLLQIHHLMVLCFMIEGESRLALRAVNGLLINPSLKHLPGLERAEKLIYLLLLFDLGEDDFLEFQLRSRKESLRRVDGFVVEKTCVYYLERLMKVSQISEKVDLWKAFGEAIKENELLESEFEIRNHFRLGEWIRARREERQFSEIIREMWFVNGGEDLRILPLSIV